MLDCEIGWPKKLRPQKGDSACQQVWIELNRGVEDGRIVAFFQVKRQDESRPVRCEKSNVQLFETSTISEPEKIAEDFTVFRPKPDNRLLVVCIRERPQGSKLKFAGKTKIITPAPSTIDEKYLLKEIDEFLGRTHRDEWRAGFVSDPGIRRSWEKPSATHPNCTNTEKVLRKATAYLVSCQYPSDLFNRRFAYRSLTALRDCASQSDEQYYRSLLVAGDSVYVDPTGGYLDPVNQDERYFEPYRRLYNEAAWKNLNGIFANRYHSIDDHELENNWEPTADSDSDREVTLEKIKQMGTAAYLREHLLPKKADEVPKLWSGWHRISAAKLRGVDGQPNGELPVATNYHDGFPLFIMDTRTERGKRTAANIDTARLTRCGQWKALQEWIKDERKQDVGVAPKPKLILGAALFLPRRLSVASSKSPAASLHSDAWDGYPASLEEFLIMLLKKEVQNVIVLSGDEHIPCIARVDVSSNDGKKKIRLWSIHSPPLHAPWTFVNSIPESFACDEIFNIFDGERNPDQAIKVTVKAKFPGPGDGFSKIELSHSNDKAAATVSFFRADSSDADSGRAHYSESLELVSDSQK